MSTIVSAQNGTWTWMHGSSTPDQLGNFGTIGVASPTNNPPSLYEACEWTDHQGKFWIFGGSSFVGINLWEFSALWKFDPVTNEWTWMKGPSAYASAGVYGVQGVPSPANYPGARAWGVTTWVDLSGNLWLYGGLGYDGFGVYGGLNDLWKYDVTTNEWTWMKGPNTANFPSSYGTLQVPANSNLPDGKYESSASWVSNAGDLWMYGGDPFNTLMWKYSIATNQWTWMSGSASNIPPNWGTMYVPSSSNTPGARLTYGKWKDAQGNFWMFGGDDFNNNAFADMWMYNNTTNLWTWMGGSTILNDPGTFQTQCQTTTHYPRARYENRACWTDACGRFWEFGGGFTTTTDYSLNDLFVFDPVSLQFDWIGGTNLINQPGNYGTILVPASTNYPASAIGGVGFVDTSGNFWMFGGAKLGPAGRTNAMWKYQRDPVCPSGTVLNASLTSNPNGGCAPVTINPVPNYNGSSFQYQWDFGDTSTLSDTSNLNNPAYTYTIPGTYTVTLIIKSSGSCGTLSDTTTSTIVVNDTLRATVTSTDLTCNNACNGTASVNASGGTGYYSYSWSNSQTGSNITSLCAGNYIVTVTDSGSCITTQSVNITQPSSITASMNATPATCNTSTGSAIVTANGGTGTLTYNWTPSGGTNPTANNLAAGIYTVTITDANGCSDTATANITSVGAPVTSIQSLSNVACFGDSSGSATINANGNGPFTYSWSPSGGNAAGAINLSAQTYSVTVTDAGACTTIQTVLITEPSQLSAIISSDTATCGNNNGNATVNVTGGTGTYTYLWNNLQATSIATNLGGGTYSVTVTDSNGCTLSDSVIVASTTLPIVILNTFSNVTCSGGNDGGASINVSGGQSPYFYSWSPVAQPTSNPTNLSAGIYTVTVTGIDGCAQTQTVLITEPSPIQITISSLPENCTNADGSLSANVSGGIPGYSYNWSNSDTTAAINNLPAGNYSITITDANGCVNVATAMVGSVGSLTANAGPSVTIASGQSTPLNGSGGTSYNWLPAVGLSCSTCQNPIASPTVTTTYTLTVMDSLGCTATDTVTIFVDIACGEVYLPNAFSPNGDNQNDILFVRGNCIKFLQFDIYNRWGEKVFTTTNPAIGWDGTWRNKECEAAVFTYALKATLIDGTQIEKQGNVSLVR